MASSLGKPCAAGTTPASSSTTLVVTGLISTPYLASVRGVATSAEFESGTGGGVVASVPFGDSEAGCDTSCVKFGDVSMAAGTMVSDVPVDVTPSGSLDMDETSGVGFEADFGAFDFDCFFDCEGVARLVFFGALPLLRAVVLFALAAALSHADGKLRLHKEFTMQTK